MLNVYWCSGLLHSMAFSVKVGVLIVFMLILIGIAYASLKLLWWMWYRYTNRDEKTLGELSGEVDQLKERLVNRRQTLESLERQVSDIVELFEVAKHFNECLTIEEVVKILNTKVREHLHSHSAYLVLLDTDKTRHKHYCAYILSDSNDVLFVDAADEERWKAITALDQYIEVAQEHKEIVRIDYPVQYQDFFDVAASPELICPLWIFPLIVENKLIAVYCVQGAGVNDFSKYAIIAAQLALQIKKIRLYADVKELSITDGLTKVFLRRHFMERFEGELKRSIKYKLNLCVLMIDIDHFKEYNDNYGHLVGDVTLREVSNVIKDNVRRVDLVGRYGGEEFIVVLPETNKQGGVDAAERIRSATAKKRLKVFDEETKVTISIGVAAFPDNLGIAPESFVPGLIDDLVQHADSALYKAKEEGRNRVVVSNPQ